MSQKSLAKYLGLSPSTISLVMNKAPLAASIPEATQKRIFEAAKRLNYRPDFYAKYLYSRRSYTVALLLPEIGEGFSAPVISGIDACLVREKYFYFLANHHGQEELIGEYPRLLMERAVEGFILLNTAITKPLGCPAVSIGRQAQAEGIAHVVLDNYRGGWLALEHLAGLGHRRIAVLKGHAWRSATEERWQGIADAAERLAIRLDPDITLQLRSSSKTQEPSVPEEGYELAKKLLRSKTAFTALIAFNDVSAIGAVRAFWDAGLRVPEDISVVGFDDIQAAAYQIPRLTTLRQPLRHMGELAASTLLKMIRSKTSSPKEILVEPELVVRESTGSPSTERSPGKGDSTRVVRPRP